MTSRYRKRDVFLCYNSDDFGFAQKLKTRLEALGVTVWMDVDNDSTAGHSHEEHAWAVTNTDFFIALNGRYGLGTEQKRELHAAKQEQDNREKKEKPGLSIRLIHVPGYRKRPSDHEWNYLAATYGPIDFRSGIEREKLYALVSSIKGHTVAPPPPVTRPAKDGLSRRILTLAGGSGAGTGRLCSELSKLLTEMFGRGACGVLSMESYYKGGPRTKAQVSQIDFGKGNYDDPSTIDFKKLEEDLRQLQLGATVEIPIYSKQRHVPVGFRPVAAPKHIIVVEGAYMLQSQVPTFSDATFFIDVDAEFRFCRRISKDLRFGMRSSRAMQYYLDVVRPAYSHFIEDFIHIADQTIHVLPHQNRFNLAQQRFDLDFRRGALEVLDHIRSAALVPTTAPAAKGK